MKNNVSGKIFTNLRQFSFRLAVVANLAFNVFSKCDLGKGEEVCDKSKLELRAIARVQGNEKDGIVTVIKLTKIAGP